MCASAPLILGAKILNCSVLASYHNVRSYYLRVYEAKFILGAIAASLSETDEIGYIADYPIYGTPASINAFALGAQLVNPRAKIVLEWSTLPGHSPEAALAARGVHIISSRDISAPHLESRRVRPVSRAGRRHLQPRHAGLGLGQALRGHRPQHPHRRMERRGRTQRRPRHELLYGYVHRRHRSHLLSTPAHTHASAGRSAARTHPGPGAFLPFVGRLPTRAAKSAWRPTWRSPRRKSSAWIIWQDNIVGRIPSMDELNDVAKGLVSLQGIRAATKE